jgi:hypothetical protein
MIMLAHGLEKRADEIRAGDMLKAPGHRKATVRFITKGSEAKIWHIVTEGGRELRATDTHPIVLEDGTLRRANKLLPGDVVRTEYGTDTVKENAEEDFRNKVYNFALDVPGCVIIANGIQVGDFELQNSAV